MTVCVYGLWHLGSVTAACLARAGIRTIGLDPNARTIAMLATGMPPLFEPGLEDLIKGGLSAQTLSFTTELPAVAEAEIVWVAFDTPVDDEDRADTDFVVQRIEAIFPYLRDGAVVLVSSQLPVGSIREIEQRFASVASGRSVAFAYSPENLRLGQAIKVFTAPGRIVVGVRNEQSRQVLGPLLQPFCDKPLWMSVESAEMTKHALNAYLATAITYINEIAVLCEKVGADARDVEAALRTDPRIGANAYVRPGAPFAGGTLARDVVFLTDIAARQGLELPLLAGVVPSNRARRHWPLEQVASRLGNLRGSKVAVLGLTYKPGTDTLRRSLAVELCTALTRGGAAVIAFDPAISRLPSTLDGVLTLAPSAESAVVGADAAIIATEWPAFRGLAAHLLVQHMRRPLVIDHNGFLAATLASDPRIDYVTTGTTR